MHLPFPKTNLLGGSAQYLVSADALALADNPSPLKSPRPTAPVDLSIIIVNWNSANYVRNCLRTLSAHGSDISLEVIVVDAGSFDGCGEMIANSFPSVQFIQSQENSGFGASNNLGFSRATGECVLFLNPDTEVRPRALQLMLEELRRRPDAGILGARLLNSDGSLQTSCVQALPTPLNQALGSEWLRQRFPNSRFCGLGEAFRSTKPVQVEAVSGACMLLPAAVFRRAGGFSKEFFMYGEDMDLCAKVRRLGLRVYHVPSAEVVHHGGGSSRAQVSQFSTVQMRIAVQTYMHLNHGPGAAFAYRAMQLISGLIRLALLLPRKLLPGKRAAANESIAKWWFVLQWAVGVAGLRPSLNRRALV